MKFNEPWGSFESEDKVRGNILLTGLPGSGKTTVGHLLAETLNANFIDLDETIEKLSRRTIQDIFTESGESGFRNLEIRFLKHVSTLKAGTVIALGGGTLESSEAMPIIRDSRGLLIWLRVSPEIATKRLLDADSVKERPLLCGIPEEDLPKKLDELLQKRLGTYLFADFALDTDTLEPRNILNRVLDILPREWLSGTKGE